MKQSKPAVRKRPVTRKAESSTETPLTLEQELRKLERTVRRIREKTLTDAIDALERESNALHVRDAGLDDGIQRSIRVLWDMKRR